MSSQRSPGWYRNREPWFRIFELFVIVSATCIAWRALERNTEGLLASCTTQLFDADTQVEKEEFDGADKPVWSIYGGPNTTDPTAYCHQLIAAIAKHTNSIAAIPNATLLNQKLVELNPPEDEIQDIADLRRVKSHLTLILNELHTAYDFWSKGVMKKAELETWLGYLTLIGPHPLFLAEIEHWKQGKFMSRNFAEMLQGEMIKDPVSRNIIRKFYPEMDTASFQACAYRKWNAIRDLVDKLEFRYRSRNWFITVRKS
jgi:hypothetical protein